MTSADLYSKPNFTPANSSYEDDYEQKKINILRQNATLSAAYKMNLMQRDPTFQNLRMKIAKKNPGLNPQKLSEKAFKRMFGGTRN